MAVGDDGPDLGAYRGDRVVVRYLLGEATPADWRDWPNPAPARSGGPTQSDVTGFLVDDGDPVRLDRNGTVEEIPRAAITSLRVLSAVPVRNSEIRALEHAAAAAWPGTEQAWIEGWLVRAGAGISRRANSAIALDRSARLDPATRSAIESWYAARDLPTLIATPERLVPPGVDGVPASPVIHVLTAGPTTNHPFPEHPDVILRSTPTPDWLRAYLGPATDIAAATAVLGATLGDAPVTFAAIEDAGRPIAIGRGAVTESPDGTRMLGLTALWTDPARRREHLGDAMLTRLRQWGAENGAAHAYLQVESGNRIAGTWYRARGFALHHRYRYIEPRTST
ncbi:GNAT family N-acetyltransferase [Gordonia polyisoprenivorans]|uniref:N-acetylglutamate synthase, CG3035 family n=1 Tax=Gordonia polyisoprenivorans TaxID=84595 RepID=UPI000B99E9E3|nr:GNAT family N-acetyltransferase [Gordonia polyisoprenivorans]OZC33751.1 GNAT family N-acetyltransferase [Gordonia polyisoprenivorans]UZF57192.1 GNAT family N-acetyltransferase [Gordonia polyisoprenivorans]